MTEPIFIAGTDIGGTFTDCALIDAESGRVFTGKAPTTHGDLARGLVESIETALKEAGAEGGLESLSTVLHGTTVGTNAVVENKGARTGALVTRGHADAMAIMRVDGRVASLSPADVVRMQGTDKPAPVIPRSLIREVDQRTDYRGREIVPLDEAGVRQAVTELLEAGVEAIAIVYLWSFMDSTHEVRSREIAEAIDGDVFLACSSELAPRLGEYERMTAAALNGFIGPVMSTYLTTLDERLRERGFGGDVLVMQCGGGVVPLEEAIAAPIGSIDSGPAGGLIGTTKIGASIGVRELIATDMGGTSFDVGLVSHGVPNRTGSSVINQYTFYVPRVDISSIGSGGGSIIRIDEQSGGLRVGPQSAGSMPGPACFGRGTAPTVTDANLIVGHLNPSYFLSGRIELDSEASVRAMEPIAAELGTSVEDAALGSIKVVDAQMADLIRKKTVESGRDPRSMTILAFGGAGPLHASGFARELGVSQVLVPLGDVASIFSAYGIGMSDLLHVHQQSVTAMAPFDSQFLADVFGGLEAKADTQLEREGVPSESRRVVRSGDMQYAAQINEIEVELPGGEIDDAWCEAGLEAFGQRYEELYGKGTGYAGAGIVAKTLRVTVTGARNVPAGSPESRSGGEPTTRPIYIGNGAYEEFSTYRVEHMEPGIDLVAPAVLELPDTTVLLRSGDRARVDDNGNIVIDIGGPSTESPSPS